MTHGPDSATVANDPGGDGLAPLLRWLKDQPGPTTVELVCAHHAAVDLSDPVSAVVVLPDCAVTLTLACFLELAEMPALTSLKVRTDGCPDRAAIVATVREAAALIAAAHAPLRLTVQDAPGRQCRDPFPREVFPLRAMPVTRRALFTLGTSGKLGPDDGDHDARSRARAALRRLGGEGTERGAGGDRGLDICALRDIPAAAATLALDRCTACAVCVKGCPTGALRLTRTATAFSLIFDVSSCTDCGQCIRLCPERTLMRTGRSDWAEIVKGAGRELAHGEARSCSRCSGSFTPGAFAAGENTDLCPVCAYRRSRPFGSKTVARRLG
jgi:ferredoxin